MQLYPGKDIISEIWSLFGIEINLRHDSERYEKVRTEVKISLYDNIIIIYYKLYLLFQELHHFHPYSGIMFQMAILLIWLNSGIPALLTCAD